MKGGFLNFGKSAAGDIVRLDSKGWNTILIMTFGKHSSSKSKGSQTTDTSSNFFSGGGNAETKTLEIPDTRLVSIVQITFCDCSCDQFRGLFMNG